MEVMPRALYSEIHFYIIYIYLSIIMISNRSKSINGAEGKKKINFE